MVDLPQIPRRLVTSQAPQSMVSAREIAGPGLALQGGLETLGKGIEDAAEPMAREAGKAAVSRGPDGTPQINAGIPIFGRLGNVFAESARAAFQAQSDSTMQTTLADHRLKLFQSPEEGGFGGDVAAWRAAGEQVIKAKANAYRGGEQTQVMQNGMVMLDQYQRDGMTQKLTMDTDRQKADIAARIGQLTNNITALARDGGTGTDEYNKSVADVQKLYGDLVKNPLFGVPQAKADAALTELQGRAKANAVVGNVERIYKAEGFDAAEKQAKSLLTEKSLSEGDRGHYFNLAMGQIRLQETERRAVIAGINQEVSQHESSILSNPKYDRNAVADFKDKAAKSGAVEAWNRIQAAEIRRNILDMAAPYNGAQRADLLAGGTMPVLFQRLSAAAQLEESQNNPNAESPKGASGLMQVVPKTAREIAKQLGDPNFPTNGSDEDVKNYLKTAGGGKTGKAYGDFYLAKQLRDFNGDVEAALVAYNAGPERAKEWVAGGKDKSTLPTETQNYLTRVMGNFNSGAVSLPAAGQRMTADNWTLSFYRPGDMMAKTAPGQWVDARAATAADQLGQAFFQATGKRIAINSGAEGTEGNRRGTRDPNDNPGADHSKHLDGMAFDFQIQDLTPQQKAQFLTMARQMGFGGVGFYEGKEGHIHLDMGAPRSWGNVPDWAKEAMQTPVAGGNVAYTGVGNRRAQAIQGSQAGTIGTLNQIAAGNISPAYDPYLQGQLRQQLQADFNDLFPRAMRGFEGVQTPSPGDIQTLGKMAVQLGDQKKADQVAEMTLKAQLGEEYKTLTEPERAARLAGIQQEFQGRADADKRELTDYLSSLGDRIASGMKSDPWATASAMGLPVPSAAMQLDFSNPQSLSAGLAMRAKDSNFLSQHEGLNAIPAMKQGEIDKAKDVLRNGTPDQIAGMMSALSVLPENMRMATLSRLVEKGDVDPYVQAIALYKDNPQVSRSIINGLAILKEGKTYEPEQKVFFEEFNKAMPPTQFGFDGNGNSNSRQLEMVRQAVMARAADLQYQTGNPGKQIQPAAIDQAIKDVTGGVVSWNGAKVIVPRYGMADGEFAMTMKNIKPEDLRGAVSLNGTPLTPRDLQGVIQDKANPFQPAYRLQSVGEGQYIVYSDVGGARRYVMTSGGARADRDAPFILDLRPAAALARQPWLQSQSVGMPTSAVPASPDMGTLFGTRESPLGATLPLIPKPFNR